MEFIEEIGKRIKMIRVYSGFKQKNLAEKLNIQAPLLSLYEQGKREPSMVFLKKFCDFYNMSLSQFFAFLDNDNIRKVKANKDLEIVINDLNKSLANLEKMNLSNIKNAHYNDRSMST